MSDAVSMSDAGTELATDGGQIVLDELVGQMLLAQSARAQGFVVDDAALQARLDVLSTQLGGTGALQEWMSAHGYTEADFRAGAQALGRSRLDARPACRRRGRYGRTGTRSPDYAI